MALNINAVQLDVPNGDYVSPARICVTADGELVSADDPRGVRLLVGEGGTLPRSEAERYGLIASQKAQEPAAARVEEAVEEVPEPVAEPVQRPRKGRRKA